jgi:hypothetical protein
MYYLNLKKATRYIAALP